MNPYADLLFALGFGDVLRMVINQGQMLAVLSVVVGLAGALAVTRAIRSLFFGVSAIG
jgi:hypothetical protein